MNKDKVLEKLDRAWRSFQDSYSDLTREQLLKSGVTGDWSVKEIISHVTWWEGEALKHLPLIIEGGRPKRYSVLYGGIDAFNLKMATEKRTLSLVQVLKEQEDTHQNLINYLHSIPEDQFLPQTRFLRRLRLDTYGHYQIHTRAILDCKLREGMG